MVKLDIKEIGIKLVGNKSKVLSGGYMILKCNAICTEVHKKSQSPAFKELQVGDCIEFSVRIQAAGRNKGTYATYIRCFNPKTNQVSELSFNQIGKTLSCFEFKEI